MNIVCQQLYSLPVQYVTTVLLHFVWQGFLIAAVISLALRRTGAEDAHRRHGIALFGLLSMVVVPVATGMIVQPEFVSLHDALDISLPASSPGDEF